MALQGKVKCKEMACGDATEVTSVDHEDRLQCQMSLHYASAIRANVPASLHADNIMQCLLRKLMQRSDSICDPRLLLFICLVESLQGTCVSCLSIAHLVCMESQKPCPPAEKCKARQDNADDMRIMSLPTVAQVNAYNSQCL